MCGGLYCQLDIVVCQDVFVVVEVDVIYFMVWLVGMEVCEVEIDCLDQWENIDGQQQEDCWQNKDLGNGLVVQFLDFGCNNGWCCFCCVVDRSV